MRRPAKALVAIFASLLSILAVAGPAAAAPPTLTIDAPSSVSYTSAHVEGTVNPNGGPGPIYVSFSYRKVGGSWEYLEIAPIEGAEGEGSNPVPVETDLTGLKPGVEYEVRIRTYSEGAGESFSPEPNPVFTTTSLPAPAASIDAPASVTGTTAQFSGTIDPEAPVGNPAAADVNWRFECIPACPGPSGTIAADSSPHAISAEATGLDPNTDYEVTLVAENAAGPVNAGPEAFTTLKVAPALETRFPGELPGSQMVLRGWVNPRNSAVTYQFEWGTTTAYGNVVPATPVALAFQGNSRVAVSTTISGLAPGTTYHYRLVGTNTETSAVGHSGDQAFTTASLAPPLTPCANDIFRVGFAALLPDCRAYEQVTPVDKGGLEPVMDDGIIGDNFLVRADGSLVQYLTPGAFGDAVGSLQYSKFQASRGSGDWKSHGIELPLKGSPIYQQSSTIVTSRDLSHSVGMSFRALTPGAVSDQYNFYLQDNTTGERELVLSTAILPFFYSLPGPASIGGTPDFSHLVFIDTQPLTPNAPDNGLLKLYEYSDGEVRLVSYGPDDQPSNEEVVRSHDLNNTISADGSRIFYALGSTSLYHAKGFYERRNGHTQPVAVSQRIGEEGRVDAGVARWVNADGSVVYFSSNQPLTDDAGERAEISGSWLYRKDEGGLTVVTPVEADGPPSADQFAFSKDGEYAYFLEEDLFAWHAGQLTTIGEGFGPSSLVGFGPSDNGRFLAISTQVPITGYENLNPEKCQGGEEAGHCSQVYLFDALTKELECASCRTDGGLPTGRSNFGAAQPESAVTNDGTVYFSSPDPLVGADVNGRPDVYQFRDGVRTLISTGASTRPAFLGGVSADGQDVYFSTDAPLVRQDRDRLLDVYSARVNGGLAGQWPPEPPAPCEGEACKGPTSSPPGTATPGTESFHGTGNGNARVAPSHCKALSTKARGATKKAKAKPKGKQRGKAMKHAKKLTKKASKCRAGAAR